MRLFYGLTLPAGIADACAQTAARAREIIPGRYALKSNYHITLAFIGNVDEARLGEAADVLGECVRFFPAPRVTLGGLSYFNRTENAILIVGAQAEPDLSPLHDALVRGLVSRGLPADMGPFCPHVTLARHARIEPGALEAAGRAQGTFVCPQAYLFLSARDGENVLRYTPVCGAAFGG